MSLLEQHVTDGNPAGVICHGPWLLVEANVVDDRTVTSYPSLKTDIRNADGEWVDEEVVIVEEAVGTFTSHQCPDCGGPVSKNGRKKNDSFPETELYICLICT